MYIPDAEMMAGDWVFLGGVLLALVVGMATRRETATALAVLILTVGLSTAAKPAAGYIALLPALLGRLWAYMRA